jgi:phospholipid/cholesterol/gamma-HCH transport system substrate-binding protein
MKHNVIETIMGAVVLTTAAFFIIFAYRTSGFEDNDNVKYSAHFDRIDGLVIGSDVRISGIKVGAVKSTVVDPKTYLAQVIFTVDPQIKLPKDTSAEIASEGLLGGKFIAIVPGGETVYLQPGGVISYTQSSVNLESLIGQLIFSSKKEGETNTSEAKKHNK